MNKTYRIKDTLSPYGHVLQGVLVSDLVTANGNVYVSGSVDLGSHSLTFNNGSRIVFTSNYDNEMINS